MGTHIRSVMSKTILIILVVALVWHESFGSNDLERIKEAKFCNNYQEVHVGIDSLFKAKYEFQITHDKGNYEFAREQCHKMGGDLITVHLGPEGKEYHEKIRDLVRSRNVKAWIGITDRGEENDWRFPSTVEKFNITNHDNVFKWYKGEPNNWGGNQHCAYVGYKNWDSLDDGNCDKKHYGLCEKKVVDCDANVV